MFDATKPMLPKMGVRTEYDELAKLLQECNAFLDKWGADRPYHSTASPDAMVAVFQLHAHIVARRSYIMGLLDKEDLPF